MFFLFVLSSLVVTLISYTIMYQFLRKFLIKANYRGRKVPTGGGLVLILSYVLTVSFYVFTKEEKMVALRHWLLPLTILVTGMGILGFVDDMFGSREIGGFRGHFGELFKGHITTGAIKAIGGGMICLVVAQFFSSNLTAIIINGLLMALSANIFNLLDLRPGRTLKLFLILGIVIFLFSFRSAFWTLSGVFLGTCVILLLADLSESCMLGDVGSNALGSVIGFSFVANFSWMVNACILLLVLLVQIYAESHSISEFIESNQILRSLDEFGRRKTPQEMLKRRQKTIIK